MHKIEITYTTGDSENSSIGKTSIELTWENIVIAKENLQRIKDHYTYYNTVHKLGTTYKKNIALTKDMIGKAWIVNKPKLFRIDNDCAIDESVAHKFKKDQIEYRPDLYYAKHCVMLKTDQGVEMQYQCFWCGEFESLHSAEIISDSVNDMKIEF